MQVGNIDNAIESPGGTRKAKKKESLGRLTFNGPLNDPFHHAVHGWVPH